MKETIELILAIVAVAALSLLAIVSAIFLITFAFYGSMIAVAHLMWP